MAIPYVVGGLGIALSKRRQNRLKQAAANEFSQKYPLLDQYSAMQSSVDAAVIELKNIDASPAETAGAKRVKKRNSATLRKWIIVMNDHLKDLRSGMSVATTKLAPKMFDAHNRLGMSQQNTPMATTVVMAEQTQPIQTVLPQVPAGYGAEEPKELSQVNTETDVNNTGNLAAPTKEKGVNWLLIGGAALAVYFGYKYFKK